MRKKLINYFSGYKSNSVLRTSFFFFLSFLFLISCSQYWPKHVGPKYFSLESAEHLPEEFALNHAKLYFDINSEGILLQKDRLLFFRSPIPKYRRFSLEDTHLYIESYLDDKGSFKKSYSYHVILSTVYIHRPEDFSSHTTLNKVYDEWWAWADVSGERGSERGFERIQKLVNALVSLGVNFDTKEKSTLNK